MSCDGHDGILTHFDSPGLAIAYQETTVLSLV